MNSSSNVWPDDDQIAGHGPGGGFSEGGGPGQPAIVIPVILIIPSCCSDVASL